MHPVRRSPALRRLALAETLSPFGDALATVAVILHLLERGGSGSTVAVVMFAEAIPPVLSPVAGALADRARDPRRLLTLTALGQAATVIALSFVAPSAPLLAIAALLFARAAIDTVAAPALGTLVVASVADDDLPAANALIGGARELGAVLGPPVAGLLIALADVRVALMVDAATFLAVIPLVLGVRFARPDAAASAPLSGLRADIAAGARALWANPRLRAVAVAFWVMVFVSAPDDLVLSFLGRDALGAGPVGIGVLLGAASAGLVLASPLLGRVARRLGAPTACALAGGFVMGLGNLLTAVAPVLALAFAAQVVRGAGTTLFDAAGVRTLIQRETPRPLLGRVLANVYGGVSVAAALGYVAAGPFLDATSPRIAFAVIGTGGIGGIALMAFLLRQARGPSPIDDSPPQSNSVT